MLPSLPLLSCELSVSVKKPLIEKKNEIKIFLPDGNYNPLHTGQMRCFYWDSTTLLLRT